MRPINFSKLSGSGNDFIIIDNREGIVDTNKCVDFVRKVCARATSVGADGVIFIENDPQKEYDFAWRFFNADGSEAEMCGNGGRCAARYAHSKGIAGKGMSFRTLAGVIQAQITSERTVKLQLTPPLDYRPEIHIEVNGGRLELMYLDTGVPHAVVDVEDVSGVDVKTVGADIRYHDQFAPKGANANFVQVTSEDSLLIRTYERGVEGETLACGTGSVAAAVTMALSGRVKPPVKLTTAGGEVLTVHFELTGALPENVYFEGAVKWVYDAILNSESLL